MDCSDLSVHAPALPQGSAVMYLVWTAKMSCLVFRLWFLDINCQCFVVGEQTQIIVCRGSWELAGEGTREG